MSSSRINSPDVWKTLVASDSEDQPEYRAVYIKTAGNLVVEDKNSNEESFPVVVGQTWLGQMKRFKTSSTAAGIGMN